MKDIMDIYEDSKFPTLLEILFFMIMVMEVVLATWITFMAPLHIGNRPSLQIAYLILLPITYGFPLIGLVAIKKAKKHLLSINTTYLSCRALYFSFFFFNEMQFRIAEKGNPTDFSIVSDIVKSGVTCIVFTVLFSLVWIVLIHASKNIKDYCQDAVPQARTAEGVHPDKRFP